ncbi:hypothetical protein L9F63_021853, partial [Diploptera punctata]
FQFGSYSSIMASPAVEKKSDKPFRVSIEGNIGAGKSTLIQYFSRFPEVDVHVEPVAEWCNVRGHNLLDMLYKDLNRHNYMFQHYVQLTRVKIQTHKTDKKVHIFERSLQNNRFCFIEMAHKAGQLLDPEYLILCQWYEWIEQNFDIDLDLIVYLRSSPEVVYERIKKRNRSEESTVSLDYLRQLHESYEKWLFHSNISIPVLQINVDNDIEEVEQLYVKHQGRILGHDGTSLRV